MTQMTSWTNFQQRICGRWSTTD